MSKKTAPSSGNANETKSKSTLVDVLKAIGAIAAVVVPLGIAYVTYVMPEQQRIAATQTAEARAIPLATQTVGALALATRASGEATVAAETKPGSTSTASPSPVPIAAPNATPTRVAWISSPLDNAGVSQSVTVVGNYAEGFDGNLWLFSRNPNNHYYAHSLFYHETNDECKQQGIYEKDGRWELPIGLGVAADQNKDFDLYLTLADTETHRSLLAKQQAWCMANSYPGFAELPTGVSILDHIKVHRTRTEPELPPDISNAVLPGQVSFSNLAEGATVPQVVMLQGENLQTRDDVWILVRPEYGRWYPQSLDACKSLHTSKVDAEHWTVRTIFGGPTDTGKPYDVVAVLADKHADEFLDAKQREWCGTNYYPGLLTLELPQGIAQKAHVRVYRDKNSSQ